MLTNLSKKEYSKNYYLHYRSWNEAYDYIRAEDCGLPKHLRKRLMTYCGLNKKIGYSGIA